MKKIMCLVALLATIIVAPSARADILYTFGDCDMTGWTKVKGVAAYSVQPVPMTSAPDGDCAIRYEVHQGDDPIDASGDRAEASFSVPYIEEGEDRWYGWSTMWRKDFPSVDTWQLFTQFHHTGLSGSPPLELYVRGEEMMLRMTAEDASAPAWRAPLERNRWRWFVLHVVWSSNSELGLVELWVDGAPQLARHGRTLYAGQGAYLKQGLYRSDTVSAVGVLWHDDMTIATSRDDVMPAAPAAPDAGAPDAGVPPADAGLPDAAGAPDAGIPDAGIPDAAPPTDLPPTCGSISRETWAGVLLAIAGGLMLLAADFRRRRS